MSTESLTNTDDLRILAMKELISPETLIEQLPVSQATGKVVSNARNTIHNILVGEDDRLLVIVGPVPYTTLKRLVNMLVD